MTTPTADQPARRRRRWCQFSLRSVMLAVAIGAIPLCALRLYLTWFAEQQRTMALIEELDGRYETELGGTPWLRKVVRRRTVSTRDCGGPRGC